jgi:hypothetical protein
MTDLQSIRAVTAIRFLPLDDGEIRGIISDGVVGSLSIGSAAEKITNQIGDRASTKQIIAASLGLLREQAAELAQLEAEADRLDVELEGLRADAEAWR